MTPLPESAVSAPDATTERLAAGVLSSGAADAAPSPPREPPAAMAEEVDVWWGSYSGWTLWPSMVLCLLLTGLIGLGVWIWIPRELTQWTFLGLAAVLWLGQGLRWAHRFFSYNYRLTTRRLFRDRGFFRPELIQISLKTVARVEVKRNAAERLAHVGRLYVYFIDPALPPLVFHGVRHPQAVAQLVEEWRMISFPPSEVRERS